MPYTETVFKLNFEAKFTLFSSSDFDERRYLDTVKENNYSRDRQGLTTASLSEVQKVPVGIKRDDVVYAD